MSTRNRAGELEQAMKRQLTLHAEVTYRIEVQGHLDQSWRESVGMDIRVETDDPLVTSLTGVVDQAGLHGVLRRLYSIGLPLISVAIADSDRD